MASTKVGPPRVGDTFFHSHEFGPREFSFIPGTAALTGRVAIWAPSAAQIATEHRRRNLNFGPGALLDWIDEGLVQVAARHEWLLSSASRERGAWQDAPWTLGFDDVLAQWAKDDASIPDVRKRRVVGLETGTGYLLARKALEASEPVVERVRAHVAKGSFSKGILRAAKLSYSTYGQAKDFSPEQYETYFLMASVYNHVEAQQHLACDVALSNEGTTVCFQDILRDQGTTLTVPQGAPALTALDDFIGSNHFDEVIEFFHFLLQKRDKKSLLAFANRKTQRDFLREVSLNPQVPPLLRLESELETDVSDLSWRSYSLAAERSKRDRDLVGLIDSLWNGIEALGLFPSPGIFRSKVLETINVRSVKKYKDHWAFLVVGKRKPRKVGLAQMRAWLDEFKKRRGAKRTMV
jgi:hypothetical protein